MKWSLFTVASPDLSVKELIPYAAEAGLKGLEWRFKETPADQRSQPASFWGNNMATIEPGISDVELKEINVLCKEHGIETAGVMPYLGVGDLDAAKEVLRVATALEAPIVRIGVHGYNRKRSYNELLDEQLRYMESLEPMLRDHGIKGVVETHHMTISASASAAYRLVSSFDSSVYGVLFDPGNMVFEGYENHRMGLELLGDYLAHVHVKNADAVPKEQRSGQAFAWSPMEEGLVNWTQVLEDLAQVNYNGFCGVEDFSGTRSTKDMIAYYVQWISKLNDQVRGVAR